MLRSFQRLQAFDPGFKSDNVLTMKVNLPRRYNRAQIITFQQQLTERVKGLAPVQSASLASDIPLGGDDSATYVAIDAVAPPDNNIRAYIHSVNPNFFETMSIPVLRGRDFSEHDSGEAPKVAIISDSMARRLWPDDNPIGKRISIDEDKDHKP